LKVGAKSLNSKFDVKIQNEIQSHSQKLTERARGKEHIARPGIDILRSVQRLIGNKPIDKAILKL
jgi:hypothetical protein